MLVKIEARILIFPGTDFHFPSTSVPPGTFLGSGLRLDLELMLELGLVVALAYRPLVLRMPSIFDVINADSDR